jgi:uncharacterized protein YjbI with pentapeptide repeats
LEERSTVEMANKEQLNILAMGAKKWNAWREENLNVKIDLSEANLRERYLLDINFFEADLRKANLDRADLGGGHLSRANLCEASLRATEEGFSL